MQTSQKSTLEAVPVWRHARGPGADPRSLPFFTPRPPPSPSSSFFVKGVLVSVFAIFLRLRKSSSCRVELKGLGSCAYFSEVELDSICCFGVELDSSPCFSILFCCVVWLFLFAFLLLLLFVSVFSVASRSIVLCFCAFFL